MLSLGHLGMRLRRLSVFSALFTITLWAQNLAPQKDTKCMLQGTVLKEPTSEPIKKATIELITENQQEGGNYTAVSDQDGHFQIEGIEPGRYRLFAERTGYIEVEKKQHRSSGVVLSFEAGQQLKDFLIRMLPAAVVTGRVVDQDGDPMPSVGITVSRKSYSSGRQHWESAGSERTNDVGEFRIGDLLPGRYFISASPPPDFQSLATPPKEAGQTNAKPEMAYVTTYYPATTDRSQAAEIELRASEESPVNFTLVPSPTFRIRGTVSNLSADADAAVTLYSHEFNLVSSMTEVGKNGVFELRGVVPGSYTVVATALSGESAQSARQSVELATSNVEGLRLVPVPGTSVKGRLRTEGVGHVDLSQFLLLLHSEDDDNNSFNTIPLQDARVKKDGSFEWKGVPSGKYDIQLATETAAGADYFLKSLVVGERNIPDATLTVSSTPLSLDLIVSPKGGSIEGTAVDEKNQAVANAVVVAIPESRYRNRPDRYHKAVTDQHGRFNLRGLNPATYTLIAWDELDGDPYFDPQFLKNYESKATTVAIEEGSHRNVVLQVNSLPDDSP